MILLPAVEVHAIAIRRATRLISARIYFSKTFVSSTTINAGPFSVHISGAHLQARHVGC
jgi:hypothetical protein